MDGVVTEERTGPTSRPEDRAIVEIDFFQLSDTGPVRETNEDALGSWPVEGGFVFAVADGLGGHNAGEVASALAMEVLGRELGEGRGGPASVKALRNAVHQANLEIYQKAITVPELFRMGTTLTASAVVDDALVAAHIGDSRLYFVRGGKITQLTKDHTRVFEQVQAGILSEEKAREHPDRHALTRYLGHDLIASIDFLKLSLQTGDVLLQTTDGVHDVVNDRDFLEILGAESPEAACRGIVGRAKERGTTDNMSVQVAVVRHCAPPKEPRPSWWQFWR